MFWKTLLPPSSGWSEWGLKVDRDTGQGVQEQGRGHESLSFKPLMKGSLLGQVINSSWYDLPLNSPFLGALILLCFFLWCTLVTLLLHFFLWFPLVTLITAAYSSVAYWPKWDSSSSCTCCPISMSTPKPYSLHPEDGGSKVLRNADTPPHHCIVSQPTVSWYNMLDASDRCESTKTYIRSVCCNSCTCCMWYSYNSCSFQILSTGLLETPIWAAIRTILAWGDSSAPHSNAFEALEIFSVPAHSSSCISVCLAKNWMHVHHSSKRIQISSITYYVRSACL
jgi:hypothetical protein